MDAICGLQGRAHILPDGVLLIAGRRMLLYHFTSIDPTLPLDENQVTLVQQCVIVSLSLSLSLSLRIPTIGLTKRLHCRRAIELVSAGVDTFDVADQVRIHSFSCHRLAIWFDVETE